MDLDEFRVSCVPFEREREMLILDSPTISPPKLGKLDTENNSLSWENCIFLQGYGTRLGHLDYCILWTRDESKGEMALGAFHSNGILRIFKSVQKQIFQNQIATSEPGKKRTAKQVRAEEVGTVRSLCIGRFRADGREERPEGTSWSKEQMIDIGSL